MTTPKKPNSFTKYNTLDGANAGARMPIIDPEGKTTQDWLHVLGTDSTPFQVANRQMRRRIFSFIETKDEKFKDTDEYVQFSLTEQRRLQASLVTAWSFDEPCNPENVLVFLSQAPGVSEQVEEFASKRSRFVKV